jgi:hypothetical protein
MTSITQVLRESWDVIKTEPSVVLPYAVIAILLAAVVGTATVLFLVPTLIGMQAAGSLSAGHVLSAIVAPLFAAIGAAVVVSFFIAPILTGIYISIAAQTRQRKGSRASIAKAFIVARKNYIRLLEVELIVLVIEAVIAVVILSPFILSIASGTFSLTYAGLLLVAAVVLFFVSMFLFLPSVITVVENKGPIEAVKKSFEVAKAKFYPIFRLYLVLIGIGIVYGVVTGIIGVIPFVGAAIVFVMALVYSTWNLMVPVFFYLDFVKSRK